LQTPSASYAWDQDSHPYKTTCTVLFFSVSQKPSYGLGCLTVEDSRAHTHTLGRTALNLVIIVTEVAAYTTHNKHNRGVSMPSAGFEPPVSTVERLQSYALDRTATDFSYEQLSFCMFWYLCFEIATGRKTTFIPTHSPIIHWSQD
jgi:hypothetical protein